MPIRTAKITTATFALASKPSTEYSTSAKDWLRVQTSKAWTYLRATNPVPDGEREVSAHVELFASRTDLPVGKKTLQRVVVPKSLGYSKINWSNRTKITLATGSVAHSLTQGGADRLWRFPVETDILPELKTIDWRFSSSSTEQHWFKGSRHTSGAPQLVVVTEVIPVAPSNVTPQGVIGISAPLIQWPALPDQMAAQVRVGAVDEDGNWASTVWTSPEHPTAIGELNTAQMGWAGLTEGQEAVFSVRARFPAGWSDWGPAMPWHLIPIPTFTITNPGTVSADPTPPVAWPHYPGQEQWQVIVEDAQTGKLLADSKPQPGDDEGWTPPKGAAAPGQSVRRTVRLWGGEDRQGSPGDPAYAEDSVVTVWEPSTAIPIPTVVPTQFGATPAVDIDLAGLSEIPDEVIMWRDGAQVARIAGLDLPYRDWTAAPNKTHTYAAQVVVNDTAGEVSPEVVHRTKVIGLYLADPDTGRGFSLTDRELAVTYGRTQVVLTPANLAKLMVSTSALRGAEGEMRGGLKMFDRVWHPDVDAMESDLWWMVGQPERVWRLAFGDLNIPVFADTLYLVLDTERATTEDVRKVGVLSFHQDDTELPFEALEL